MRGLLLFFIIIALPWQSAIASGSCSEIKNQLVVLEAQIQSTRLDRCEGEASARCCDPSKPLSCKTFLELHTKHNELMGKLVIHEGLIAIGKAMEADHSSIQKLSVKDLRKARKNVDGFLTSYRKAALLDSSLEADFWTDKDGSVYEGQDITDLNEHIASQCSREEPKIKDFCSKLEASKSEEAVSQLQIKIALANFARADSYGRLSPADRINDYEKYRKALQLSVGGKAVSYDQDHPQVKQIAELRELLARPEEGLSDDQASEILEIAKGLDEIDVNFGEHIRPTPKFKEFFDSNLASGIAGFNQASRTLLEKDKMIENMDKLENVFSNHISSSMTSIEENIKDKTGCSGSGDGLIACFKKECAQTVTGECSQTSDKRLAQTLHSINRQIKGLENFSELQERIEEAKSCLKKPVSADEAKNCSEQLRRKIGLVSKDEVDELRRDLHQVELAMENMNLARDVNDLKLSKAMGLRAYKSKGCLSESDKIDVSEFQTVCSNASILSFSQQAISLTEDAGSILEFTQNPFINKDLKLPAKNYLAYKTEFLRRCDENRADEVLCELYEHDEAVNGKAARDVAKAAEALKAKKTANRKLPSKVKMDDVEEADPSAAFFKGFGHSLLTKGVPFFMSYDQNSRNHDQMMNYHNNRLAFMNAQYDYRQANPTIPVYQPPSYANYGYSLYDYGSAGQFGGADSAQYYRHQDDYTQFSFAPSMVMDQYGGSNFTGQPSTTPQPGAGEGFNFSP